jgi:hypothetical protein
MMIKIIGILNILLLVACLNTAYSQQYSFSTFAFKIWNGDSVVTTLHDVRGFNHYLGTKIKKDSLSEFEVNAIYLSEDVNFQHLAQHRKGVWILFSENVKRWRPLRFFCIQKTEVDGQVKVMRIFLNYNYNSCEMPCIFGQSEFKTCDIPFIEGNFMLLDCVNIDDWKKTCKNIITIHGDIFSYILKNNLILWDIKMIK